MSDAIDAFFQSLQSRVGIHPSGVATIALFAVVVVLILALVVFARLKRARKIIAELAERLGYEPPFDDGEDIVHEEVRKDIVQRGKELKVEQLEIRIGELEAEGQHKDANFEALQKHSQELDEQLRQATLQNDAVSVQAGEQAKVNQAALEQLEAKMRDMETEHSSQLTALHLRSKELEEQLQQAFLRNDKVMALANDQALAHQRTVEQFDQQLREIEAENNAKLTALQRRSKELEEQLRQSQSERDGVVAQASEQIQAHRETASQLEQRLRQVEGENNANVNALQQRGRQVEEELHNALREKDHVVAQAGEQAQAHRETVAQLEDRIRQLEGEGKASLNGMQQRIKELEEHLQQVYLQRDQVMAQASEQAQTHREVMSQVEQRLHEIEAQDSVKVIAAEQRARDLEAQLQQAAEHHEQISAHASELARNHGETVALLEDRIRQVETERNEHLGALQHHAREVEEQLRQVAQHRDSIAAQADEQARTHGETVAQLEERIRQIEGERNQHLGKLQQRTQELEVQLRQTTEHRDSIAAQAGDQVRTHGETVAQLEERIRQIEGERNQHLGAQQHAEELEEQLRQVTQHRDSIAAQIGEQARVHGETVAQMEERIRQIEGEKNENLGALQQHTQALEEQLRQSTQHRESIAAQAGEMVRAHGETVGQLEARIRQLEGEGSEHLNAAEQRAKELEEQLERANIRNEQVAAQAGEQVQAYRLSVEKLEQRIREIEAESNANGTALQQRARELEEHLQQTASHHENERSTAQQEAQERAANIEQLSQRIRDLEAERDGKESHVQTLHGRIGELEEKLQEVAKTAAPAPAEAHGNAADQLMEKAEWITARSVGSVLPLGLVAAEVYASAALAADPHRHDATQLLAELTRIRRAFPQGLPPVPEAVSTFDEKSAAFFASDPAQAAEIAEDEARRRSRAGLNRSALLVINTALELREKTDAPDSPATLQLQELKTALVERLG